MDETEIESCRDTHHTHPSTPSEDYWGCPQCGNSQGGGCEECAGGLHNAVLWGRNQLDGSYFRLADVFTSS